jgi:hypothetical protein
MGYQIFPGIELQPQVTSQESIPMELLTYPLELPLMTLQK